MLTEAQKLSLAEDLVSMLDVDIDSILRRYNLDGTDDPVAAELLASPSFQSMVRRARVRVTRERVIDAAMTSLHRTLPSLEEIAVDPAQAPGARVASVSALAKIAGVDQDGRAGTGVSIVLNLPQVSSGPLAKLIEATPEGG